MSNDINADDIQSKIIERLEEGEVGGEEEQQSAGVMTEIKEEEVVSPSSSPSSSTTVAPTNEQSGRVYRCKYCNASFETFGLFSAHLRTEHSDILEERRQKRAAEIHEGEQILQQLIEGKRKGRGRGRPPKNNKDDETEVREKEEEEKARIITTIGAKGDDEDKEEDEDKDEEENEEEALSEDEIIAKYREVGIRKIKRQRLFSLLESLPVSSRSTKYVMKMYDSATLYQTDNNELAGLLRSVGISEHIVAQIMKVLVAWEQEAYNKLRGLGYYNYNYYYYNNAPNLVHGSGGSGGYGQPWSQPYPYQYPSPTHLQPHYPYSNNSSSNLPFQSPSAIPPPQQQYMYPNPYPYAIPPPPQQQFIQPNQISAEDVRRIIREEMREKEKKTEADRLREEMNKKITELKELIMQQQQQQQQPEGWVEYEDIIIDSTGKPVCDENGNPIKVIKRMPVSAMRTWQQQQGGSGVASGRSLIDEFTMLYRLVDQISSSKHSSSSSHETEMIREIKDELRATQAKYEALQHELTKKETEMLRNEIMNLRQMLNTASGWNNDAARLLAQGLNDMSRVLEKKSPIRDIATLVVNPSAPPPTTGDTSDVESEAAYAGLLDNR